MIKEDILLTSGYLDQDEVMVEIWLGDELFADLSSNDGEIVVSIYPKGDGLAWELPIEYLVSLLQKGRNRLND